MTKINLREQYPDFYKTDYIIEVPDEVAAVMKEHDAWSRIPPPYILPQGALFSGSRRRN